MYNITIALIFIASFIASCGEIIEVTSVNPTIAGYSTTTEFTINGKNLHNKLSISIDDTDCNLDFSSITVGKILSTCVVPDSGNSTYLVVKDSSDIIRNGKRLINLTNHYSKLDAASNMLLDESNSWVCTEDNLNDYVWLNPNEDSSSIAFNDHKYQYSVDQNEFGNLTDCDNSLSNDKLCNSYNFINQLKLDNYCNRDNWRMPTGEEIRGLIQCTESTGNTEYIDNYFPFLKSTYWVDSEFDESNADIAIDGNCDNISASKSNAYNILPISDN